MKTILSPGMVAHVWAAQSQATGKTSHGNFYFRGASLYSYGSHYVCGLIMPDGAALVNSDKHSKTTSKHQDAAWHAVSHRARFYVPALNKLSTLLQNFADAEKGSEWKARETDKLRGYVADNIRDLATEAAEYLLTLSGSKNAANVAKKMAEAATRADEKAKAQDAAQTKAGHLDTASRVSKLAKNEKELVAGLARVFANGKIHEQATALHHAHRAAKAAKRDRQAADVYRVLQLVRAEIAHRAECEARKNANGFARNQIADVRRGLASLKSGELTAWNAREIANACGNIIPFPKARRAVASLEKLQAGFSDCYEALLEKEKAEHAAKEARELSDWRDGILGARLPYRGYGKSALIRARNVTRDHTPQCAVMFAVESASHGPCNCSGTITGGTLETSQGADVPLVHAVRAFRFLKLIKERGDAARAAQVADGHSPVDVIAWERNGHSLRVGHFAIDTVWQSGNFRAGCHRIDWPEVESLAQSLGVFDVAASDDALEVTTNAA